MLKDISSVRPGNGRIFGGIGALDEYGSTCAPRRDSRPRRRRVRRGGPFCLGWTAEVEDRPGAQKAVARRRMGTVTGRCGRRNVPISSSHCLPTVVHRHCAQRV
jgi:hypothetical protein